MIYCIEEDISVVELTKCVEAYLCINRKRFIILSEWCAYFKKFIQNKISAFERSLI